jgi:hypothetical protein
MNTDNESTATPDPSAPAVQPDERPAASRPATKPEHRIESSTDRHVTVRREVLINGTVIERFGN